MISTGCSTGNDYLVHVYLLKESVAGLLITVWEQCTITIAVFLER